jgi:hypothetical protein
MLKMLEEIHIDLHVKCRYYYDFNQKGMYQQTAVKLPHIGFREDPFSGSCVGTCGRTGRDGEVNRYTSDTHNYECFRKGYPQA